MTQQKNENDLGAGLIHQTIPESAETEPRPTSRTIWKYGLDRIGEWIDIDMPIGAECLYVQSQDDRGCLWAIVDPNAPKEVRRFIVVGTGHHVPFGCVYLGTFQSHVFFVWHLFENVARPLSEASGSVPSAAPKSHSQIQD